MKRLLLVNTPYQLIVAIQLKNTVFSNDQISLLISDHFPNAEILSKKIKKICNFYEVCFIKTKGNIEKRTCLDKLVDFFEISFRAKNRYGYYFSDLENLIFDEFLCYNFGTDTYGLFSILYEYNSNIRFSFFEEGLLSYHFIPLDTKKRKVIRFIRKLRCKKSIINSFGEFYCYYPEMYHGNLKTIKIQEISNNAITSTQIKEIFDIKENINIREKYIFFTSIYDIEGEKSIGEFELLTKLSELIGKDNIILKIHPRDSRTIYKDNNFKIYENSSVPWEAIMLCGDFNNKIFLTTASSSVISSCIMLPYNIKTFFLYKLCKIEENKMFQKAISEIKKILANKTMQQKLSTIKIVNNIEDIMKSELN